MKNITNKAVSVSEIKFLSEADGVGTFEGYASLFNEIDTYGDTILSGAYAKTLAADARPKMLWQHNSDMIIGMWDELVEDARGLKVKGRLLLDIPQAKDALTLLKAGALDGLSIGFRPVQSGRNDAGIRIISEIKLYEISLVTFPGQETARVDGVKSISTIRDLERRLREAGFSRSQSCAIALRGFGGLSQCDTDQEASGVDAVRDANAEDAKKLIEKLAKLRSKINA